MVTTLKLRLPCPYLHLSLSQGKLQRIHGELGKRQVGLEDTCSGERLVPEPGFSALKPHTVPELQARVWVHMPSSPWHHSTPGFA